MPDPVTATVHTVPTIPAVDNGTLHRAAATSASGTGGVPDVSADLYRAVVDFAGAMPPVVQGFAVVFTEAGVVALGVFMLFGWWRARTEDTRRMALALLTPVVTLLAYAVSESAKLLVAQDRPCRAVPGVTPLTECPPVGDWSFPSNHATIAGAAATAVFLARRGRLGAVALCLGALVAFSRVFVGVHYPHDVLVGFALGAAVVATALALLARPVAAVLPRLGTHPALGRLLGTEPAGEPDTPGRAHEDRVHEPERARVDTAPTDVHATVRTDIRTGDPALRPPAGPPATETAPTRPIPRVGQRPSARPHTPRPGSRGTDPADRPTTRLPRQRH